MEPEVLKRKTEENPILLSELAYSYYEAGFIKDAQKAIKKFLKKFPEDSSGHLIYGLIRENEGDFGEAKNSYRKAVEINDNNIRAVARLAQIEELEEEENREWQQRLTFVDPFSHLTGLAQDLDESELPEQDIPQGIQDEKEPEITDVPPDFEAAYRKELKEAEGTAEEDTEKLEDSEKVLEGFDELEEELQKELEEDKEPTSDEIIEQPPEEPEVKEETAVAEEIEEEEIGAEETAVDPDDEKIEATLEELRRELASEKKESTSEDITEPVTEPEETEHEAGKEYNEEYKEEFEEEPKEPVVKQQETETSNEEEPETPAVETEPEEDTEPVFREEEEISAPKPETEPDEITIPVDETEASPEIEPEEKRDTVDEEPEFTSTPAATEEEATDTHAEMLMDVFPERSSDSGFDGKVIDLESLNNKQHKPRIEPAESDLTDDIPLHSVQDEEESESVDNSAFESVFRADEELKDRIKEEWSEAEPADEIRLPIIPMEEESESDDIIERTEDTADQPEEPLSLQNAEQMDDTDFFTPEISRSGEDTVDLTEEFSFAQSVPELEELNSELNNKPGKQAKTEPSNSEEPEERLFEKKADIIEDEEDSRSDIDKMLDDISESESRSRKVSAPAGPAHRGVDDLNQIMREINQGAGAGRNKTTTGRRGGSKIMTPSLAELNAKQKNYREALNIYRSLPEEQRQLYQNRIRELEEKIKNQES